jgi:hypothetical protein
MASAGGGRLAGPRQACCIKFPREISKPDPGDIDRNEVGLIRSDRLRLIATSTFSCAALHLFWMMLASCDKMLAGCDKLPRHREHEVAAVGCAFFSSFIISRTPQI